MRAGLTGLFRWPLRLLVFGLVISFTHHALDRHAKEIDDAYIRGSPDALECFHECWTPLDDWNAQRDLFTWLTTCQWVKGRPHRCRSTTTRIADLIYDWPGWQGEW